MTEMPQAEDTQNLALWLNSVTIAGEVVTVPRIGVTAIVGGNNVGKSTLLREVNAWLARGSYDQALPGHYVIDDVSLELQGDLEALHQWLRDNANYIETPNPGYVRLNTSQPVPKDHAELYWRRKTLARLSSFFVHYSAALDRAEMVKPVPQRPDIAAPPRHPLHILQDDAQLLSEVDAVCMAIFRKSLTLDRLSGETVLRVGKPQVAAPPIDAVTNEYRRSLAELPTLDVQGDGMRSLLGLLLPVITATYPIVLIDEPEAFLHPPQAYELGRTLATIAGDRGIQVLLATHDRNLLAGLLAADTSVSVVRLDREGDLTSAHQLSDTQVRELWTDPVMRYSNVLEGLFHRVVVVAEADPDCKFYAAAIDALNEKEKLPLSPSEILFIPSGGKDGMAKIVEALRAVSVHVVACPDLDILDDASKVKKLVIAFNGVWADFQGDYEKAVNNLRQTHVEATCGQVLSQIEQALADVKDQAWTEETKKLLKPATRTRQSEFQKLKRYGISTFMGQARIHADALLEKLDDLGVCCIQEGELERLAPSVGVSKGRAWLGAALDAGAHKEEKAQLQVGRILQAAQI